MNLQNKTHGPVDPPLDCPACPRLVELREELKATHPDWHNAPVISFTSEKPRLLVIGLAPGMKGANCTGRPFTGDYAGDLLYKTMLDYGFAEGTYLARPDDGLQLRDAMITNAVRCLPPQNKPTGAEIKTCRPYLLSTLAANPSIRAVLALGRIAHETFLTALELKRSAFPFAHCAEHSLPDHGMTLFDSYHCSRYNTNTGRLTEEMFRSVFDKIRNQIP
ncbi:Uracil DNA glycosylase superfamily protein [Labrenzia sp. THAF82]|uniref:uracil-DNA glycosylase n=1 Tax=Labrenzia sp. THAF82 TaxID=2587861 RepID=UPI0012686604|nr:uracil-DNA glycosylase [Labrenzia sp. THAF82]QFT32909.1 Uracil DNA glycosylase superfamily protein [Labrenzia sp. THAF82]